MASGSLRVKELFSSRLGGIEPGAILRICVAVGISSEEAEVLLEEAARDLDWGSRGIIDGEEFLEWLYATTCKNSLVTTPRDEWPTGREIEETMSVLRHVQVPDAPMAEAPADPSFSVKPAGGEAPGAPEMLTSSIPAAWPLDYSASALEISPTAARGVETMAATATAGLEWHCPGESTPVLTEGYSLEPRAPGADDVGVWAEDPAPLAAAVPPVPIAEEPSAHGEISAVMEDDESAAAKAMPSPATFERMLGAMNDNRAMSANAGFDGEPHEEPEAPSAPIRSETAQATVFQQVTAYEPLEEPGLPPAPTLSETAQATVFQASLLHEASGLLEHVGETAEEAAPEAAPELEAEAAPAPVTAAPEEEQLTHEEQVPLPPPHESAADYEEASPCEPASLGAAPVDDPGFHVAEEQHVYVDEEEYHPAEEQCPAMAANDAAPLPDAEAPAAEAPVHDTAAEVGVQQEPVGHAETATEAQQDGSAHASWNNEPRADGGEPPGVDWESPPRPEWDNAPRPEWDNAPRHEEQDAGPGAPLVPGSVVRVRGLVRNAELNGVEGRLVRFNEHRGCWYVDIQGKPGKPSALRPENIMLAGQAVNAGWPAPASPPAEPGALATPEPMEPLTKPLPSTTPVIGLHVGSVVRICGLKKETWRNGEVGILGAWNPQDGCRTVTLTDGTHVALNVENLIPLDVANPHSGHPVPSGNTEPGNEAQNGDGLMPGVHVKLVNLKSKNHCHLNGMIGVIESWDAPRKVWNVNVVNLQDVKALKTENLAILASQHLAEIVDAEVSCLPTSSAMLPSPPPEPMVEPPVGEPPVREEEPWECEVTQAFDRQMVGMKQMVQSKTMDKSLWTPPGVPDPAPSAGRRLLIQTWKEKPELHGVAASFEHCDADTGLWSVVLDNGERFLVPPTCCLLLESTANCLALAPGMKVVVRGLKQKPEFNEKLGILECWHAVKGTWQVSFQTGKFLLKPKNLFPWVPPVSEQVPTPTTAASGDEPLAMANVPHNEPDGVQPDQREVHVPSPQHQAAAVCAATQETPTLQKGMVAKLRHISSMPILNGVCVRLQEYYNDGLWRICFEDGTQYRVTADKLYDAEYVGEYDEQQQLQQQQQQLALQHQLQQQNQQACQTEEERARHHVNLCVDAS